MDCSLPGSSVRGIFQARVLEWVAISFFRGSSQPRNWTQVSCIAGRCLTVWATREASSAHFTDRGKTDKSLVRKSVHGYHINNSYASLSPPLPCSWQALLIDHDSLSYWDQMRLQNPSWFTVPSSHNKLTKFGTRDEICLSAQNFNHSLKQNEIFWCSWVEMEKVSYQEMYAEISLFPMSAHACVRTHTHTHTHTHTLLSLLIY